MNSHVAVRLCPQLLLPREDETSVMVKTSFSRGPPAPGLEKREDSEQRK